MLETSYYTKKNTRVANKPNEDNFICDNANSIFIVLDGVSRDKIHNKYPNPSPALEITKLVLDNLYKEIIIQRKENKIDIFKAFVNANSIANKYNKENGNIIYDFLAGTVGVVCVVIGNILYYGYIGDCIGKIIHDNQITNFTTMQTENIAKYNTSGGFSAFEVRNIICNNKNHFCGYGVINGQEGAKDFIVTGNIILNNNSYIYLCSDGCEEIFNKATKDDLKTLTAQELIAQYTSELNADDRTLLVIKWK